MSYATQRWNRASGVQPSLDLEPSSHLDRAARQQPAKSREVAILFARLLTQESSVTQSAAPWLGVDSSSRERTPARPERYGAKSLFVFDNLQV
jgi:hypothetical protein